MSSTLQRKVLSLNVKELQECLDALGLRKHGRKAELQQRLFQCADSKMKGRHQGMEAVYSVLDAVLNKRLERGRTTAAVPAAHLAPGSSDAALRELIENVLGNTAVPGPGPSSSAHHLPHHQPPASGLGRTNTVIRCFCGRNSETGKMVQCEDELCGYWQHCACLGITTREQEEQPHFCEYCRLKRADPFWEVVETSVVKPVPLLPLNGGRMPVPGTGHSVMLSVDRMFQVTPDQLRYRPSGSHKLLLSCLQLLDPNPFRVHWPINADVRVNATPFKPYHRTSTNKLGANQRDEPLDVFPGVMSGQNKLSVKGVDSYAYVIMMQLCRRRSLAEVQALLKPQQSLDDALQTVVRIQKGPGGDNDDDDDVEVGYTVLSLKCPLTGCRMVTPARFSEMSGMACFDLLPFLRMAERTRKWQCPHSMKNTSIQTLQVDAYVERILNSLRDHPNVTEVEIDPDGRWRPAGLSCKWHHISEPFEPGTQGLKQEAGAGNGAADSDEESEDEMEELRRAAQAFANANNGNGAAQGNGNAGNKRSRQQAQDDTEVIDLLSDSDDDDDADSAPPAQRPRLANGAPAPVPPASTAYARQASHNAAGPGPSSVTGLIPPPPQTTHSIPPRPAARPGIHSLLMPTQLAQSQPSQPQQNAAPRYPPITGHTHPSTTAHNAAPSGVPLHSGHPSQPSIPPVHTAAHAYGHAVPGYPPTHQAVAPPVANVRRPEPPPATRTGLEPAGQQWQMRSAPSSRLAAEDIEVIDIEDDSD